MNRLKAETTRLFVLAIIVAGSWAIAPGFTSCSNYTPEQIAATSAAITSVITTTGQVVTPLVINYEMNGKVKSMRVKKPKPKPTPTSTPRP